jgi:hypothetical protein
LRILERKAVQDEVVKGRTRIADHHPMEPRRTANYLAVVVAQAIALSNERTALGILGCLAASVALTRRSAVDGMRQRLVAASGRFGARCR